MILATDLAKAYGRRTLWSGLDVTVASGSTLALTGASGSGKSTLLNCLGLLDAPDSGSIEVDGEELTRLRAGGRRRFRRHRLGYLFQSYALIDTATVEQNLAIALGAGRGRAGRFEGALDRVGLRGRGRERVSRLSGGEQQRVALARLLVKSPTLVLADEPTGALDAANAEMVLDVLSELAGHGASVVIATHDRAIAGWCDARLHLGGRGSAAPLRSHASSVAVADSAASGAAGQGACRPSVSAVGSEHEREVSHDADLPRMVAGSAEEGRRGRRVRPGLRRP